MAEYTLKYTGSEIDEKLDNMATMAYVDSAVSSVMPEFVDSVGQMTDTNKKYVLDGTIWVYGETYVEQPNRFVASTASLNTRHGTTSTKAYNGMFVTDYIPLNLNAADPLIMRAFKSDGVGFDVSIGNQRIHYFDSSKTLLGDKYLMVNAASSTSYPRYDADGNAYWHIDECLKTNGDTTTHVEIPNFDHSAVAYVRITLALNSVNTAITAADVANVSITFDHEGGTTAGFYDTGMEWSAGGGSGDTADLLVQVNENTAAIAELENSVEDLSSGSNVVTVPTYWQDAVDEVTTKVKALQDAGGADVVNFCWFSDLHYVPTSEYTQNVGKLCASLMNECDIPFTLFTGDTVTASGLPTEATMLEHIRAASDMLAPIGYENLLWLRGNHDDVWGTYNNGSTTVHFVNKTSKQKMFNVMHREQAKDFRRVYGDHGTYFYIDNTPQKVRFVCLNSQFYDGGDVTATTGQMTSGFGTEQLDWLENKALQVEDDWSVVIAFHIPPTASTINGNTYYLSQLSDGTDFRTVISNSTVDIIGIFCGHCHADAIVADDLPCPIVTITSAVNTPYDADYSTRVAGTDTETVLDVVSINKSERKIYCTRLGYGSDRETSY